MQDVTSTVMAFKGSHYDLGVATAHWLKKTKIMQNREKEWKKRTPRFDIDIKETYTIFQIYAPQIWEEIQGMQEVLNIPTKQMLLNFAHYRFTDLKDSGCSVYLGDNYLLRNYDYHPATYDGRYLLFQPIDGGLAQIGPTSRITGRMDGMNEAGLVMGYNFMHRKRPQNGFVCYMIGRLVLEYCKDVPEAIQFLKELPHRSSFSYIIMDKDLNHAIVEVSPRSVEVRFDRTCTNHFKLLTHENRNYTQESKERLQRVLKNVPQHVAAQEAFKVFNNPQYNIYSKLFKSWSGTIHTSLYKPQELEAWIALGENNMPRQFSFNHWLNNDEINLQPLEGKLDTELTFASY
ncbi:C45 family autoproteolytic acyltransferase/hydrolase [Staphylococcus sp. SQ8-PEA]|uniref:C45 family autoproteolytic acyltransferase/hydrolase n=1 Tax=Staphylococcus marylandisciuri TaxID=2981529 RepID=A0ABT2QQF0_9STAP|nr:C45 family autoproteolytic acyltransferase/hydolase [Staphylococcus marylandisciuri]MCU5746183.1 C45 family autoproteolytic acyltransferase/hydrolase [Staphylococcus marylandisciuri]